MKIKKIKKIENMKKNVLSKNESFNVKGGDTKACYSPNNYGINDEGLK